MKARMLLKLHRSYKRRGIEPLAWLLYPIHSIMW
jgi:hypothetical protein